MKVSKLFNILFLNIFLFIFVSCETPVEEIETDRNALSATDSSEAVISKSEEQPSAKEAEEVDEININDLAESELPGCAENFPVQALGSNNSFLYPFQDTYGKLPFDESLFPKTIFNHVEGLHGQGWVSTDALSFSEDKLIQIWTNSPNSRMLKGYSSRPVSLVYTSSDLLYFDNLGRTANSESLKLERTLEGNCHNSYYATTYLKAGNSISFSILNSMYGNRINSAVIAVDGVHYLFKAHSKDYTLVGGHNLASLTSMVSKRVIDKKISYIGYRCSGNLIQVAKSKQFKDDPEWFGCKDHAQRNHGVKCVEILEDPDYTDDEDEDECRFYDGAIAKRAVDPASFIYNIRVGYFMEQQSYYEEQVRGKEYK